MRLEPRLGPTPLLAALASSLLVLAVLISAGPGEALAAMPLVLLLLALIFRRYPGERLIERLAQRFRAARPRPLAAVAPARWDVLGSRPAVAVFVSALPLRGPPRPSFHQV